MTIKRLPEGESGVVAGNLTMERVEALAEYWGKTDVERTESVMGFARNWGLTAAKVREAKFDKRVMARIEEYLDTQLLYDRVEARAYVMKIMRDPKEKADTKVKAWRSLEQLAGKMNGSPQINITNDHSTHYTEMPIEELRDRLKEFGSGGFDAEVDSQ